EIVIDKSNPKVEILGKDPRLFEDYTRQIVYIKSYKVAFSFTGDIHLLNYHYIPYKSNEKEIFINLSDNTINVIVNDTDSRKNVIELFAVEDLTNLFSNIKGINESIVSWNRKLTDLIL